MRARTALVGLLKADPQWRRFFKDSCGYGALRMRAVSRQFRDELADRSSDVGGKLTLTEVEEGLLAVAREVLPETPAVKWDPDWAMALCRDALARLGERFVGLTEDDREALDLSGQAPWDDHMVRAGLDDDPAAFRAALAGWERAGRRAIEDLKEGGAAEIGGEAPGERRTA